MKKIEQLILLLALVLLSAQLSTCASNPYVNDIPDKHYVVILSMDGCRWDYPQLAPMPNLESIARRGVKLESLQPSFPSKTFPNHYSLATGLYPDHHGLVQNSFYDPELNAYYRLNDRTAVEESKFYGGEPIWVTAEKQGLKTASFFWVGSEAPVQGIQPSIWKRYEHTLPYEARIDSVIAWLQLPEKQRPRLITWYFDEPDGVGHHFGPESPEVNHKLVYLDSLLGVFLTKLDHLPIADQVNVIVTADHGMARISGDKTIYFDDYIQSTWLDTALGSNPVWMFDAKPDYVDSVYLGLKRAEHLMVWKRDSIPPRLHYGTNSRVMDVVATADINWSIGWRQSELMPGYVGGTHGYDPRFKEMHAIFYGAGPAFKIGYIHPTVENVNIYPLLARILDLKPAETDGKLEAMSRMLKPALLAGD